MLIDDVAAVLSASVAASRAMPLEEGLFLPGETGSPVKGTLLRNVGADAAERAHELAMGFLGLLPRAAVLACENLPAREGGDGSLLLHALSPEELDRARAFWEEPRGTVWFEGRVGDTRRGWLAVPGPDRLRVFEAHLRDEADALMLVPYASDTVWDREGRTMRGAYDPLGVVDAYAAAEALLLTGRPVASEDVHAALTREADLVLMLSVGLGFATTRIEETGDARPGPVGAWRRVVHLGRDPGLDAARAASGLPAWDESPIRA